MIVRTWRGYTTRDNSDAYQTLLDNEILPEIQKQHKSTLLKVNVLRRELEEEVEFFTLFYFESLTAVKAFAGQAYQTAHIPDKAKQLLSRFDKKANHYQLVNEHDDSMV